MTKVCRNLHVDFDNSFATLVAHGPLSREICTLNVRIFSIKMNRYVINDEASFPYENATFQ